MISIARREAAVTGAALTAAALVSVFAYLLLGGPDTAAPGASDAPSMQQPPMLSWQHTSEYRAVHSGIGLTVHSYIVRGAESYTVKGPEYVAALYTLEGPTAEAALSPGTVELRDDLGREYEISSHAVLGTSLGVTAGLLIAEPYKGSGRTLTLTVSEVLTAADAASPTKTVAGDWSVTYIENTQPGAPIDYTEGGRIAPEVLSIGDLTMAIAGQPGGRWVKLLIDRGGAQSAVYGRITDGNAESLSETDFRRLLKAETGADDFPPPHDWPAPGTQP